MTSPTPTPAKSAPPAPAGSPGASRPADDIPPFRYTSRLADQIETRWQRLWDERHSFRQPNPGEPGFDQTKPKFYCLDMFPYPSGAGLHVGHPEGYTATDIVCRYRRMKGDNVLHPMGWDAFGLPAEQYAIQTGVHPAITTRKSIETFRRQLKRFGFSYDWSREFGTIDPEYYKWTQWIFLRLYDSWFDPLAESPRYPDGRARTGAARPIAELRRELESGAIRVAGDLSLVRNAGAKDARTYRDLGPADQRRVIDNQRLAYLAEMTVNWCPALGTVLANDEVIDGKSERGSHPVFRKPLKQWQFRITSYAQRLLDDLALIEWPESTRTMQSEWIGRSEGAEIDFPIEGHQSLRVFTTRPDTVFGATYMVVAPEHPLVETALKSPAPETNAAALRAYVQAAKNKADVDRMAEGGDRTKTGVFTGLYATNPATGARIPIWTADYVLMGYGFGAIMAVPAHDERDFEFARTFGLPIADVVDSRVTMLLRHYGRHAIDDELASGRWRVVLADFLGLSITANATPPLLDEILDAVRTRRRAEPPPPPPAPGEADVPPDVLGTGQLSGRGGIRHTWLDALDDLKLTDGRQLRDLASRSAFQVHMGDAFTGEGHAANSANAEVTLDGLPTPEAKARIIEWLERTGRGRRRVNFRLRDWTFARQRYWGEPIPIVFDQQGNHYPISEKSLPLVLPELKDYSPVESDDPQPLLAKATAWINTTAGAAGVDPAILPLSTPVRREANTMPGSAGSSWYFLRYCDARNDRRFVSREADNYWMGKGVGGVDLYIGGPEHAVGHLLYSRFWQKVLFDLGEVATPEPFGRLFHQGMITSFAYQRPDKTLVPADQVEEVADGQFVERGTQTRLTQIVAKMSKSLKNVINPDDIIAEFGADTFRLYEMYMGPLEASKPWNTKDTIGCFRFLQRAWRLCVDEQTGALKAAPPPPPTARNDAVERQLHRTIAKVEHDIPRLAFNTSIAAMIELVNAATSSGGLTKDQIERFALVLAPFAPHMAEELWSRTGHDRSLAYEPFPRPDPAMLVDDQVEIPVSINGKVKTKIMVKPGLDKGALEAAAMADDKVKAVLEGKPIAKVIAVPGKMVNVVVK